MTKVSAIIFDCFGVLIEESFGGFMNRHFSDDPEKTKQALAMDKLFCLNKLPFDQLHKEFASMAGINMEQAGKELAVGEVNHELFEFIKQLKNNYKIGFLSNAGENPLEEFFPPEYSEYFDAVSVSCFSGFAKPHAGAYEDVREKLGVRFDECIFIDDRANYCEGAEHVGMTAIQYLDVQDIKKQLTTKGVRI